MAWTAEDPGAGDTDGVRELAEKLDFLARSIFSAKTSVASAAANIADPVWQGEASAAWQGSVTNFASLFQQVIDHFSTVTTALLSYCDQVEQIDEDSTNARNRRDNAQYDLNAANNALAQDPVLGQDNTTRIATQQLARDSAQTDLDRAVSDLEGLAATRTSADNQLVTVLNAISLPTTWRTIGYLAIESGKTSPDALALDSADILIAAAERALESEDPADLDDLAQLLTQEPWASNPAVMSAFATELGSEGFNDLLNLMGRLAESGGSVSPERAVAWGASLQSALSVGSSQWTAEQADAFAENLNFSSIGFLFGDAQNSPMGRELTVAIATRIDEMERVYGQLAFSTSHVVTFLANLQFPDRAGRTEEPMSAVLETLGRYPKAALDWLLEFKTDEGYPRIDYWAGSKIWSYDGYLGVSALLNEIQTVSGGPLDTNSYDESVWNDLCTVNTYMMTALCDNEHAVTEAFSDEAKLQIGLAIAQALPLLSYAVRDGKTSQRTQGSWDAVIFVTNEDGSVAGQERVIPAVDRAQLAELIGLAGSSVAGAAAVAAGIQRAQQSQINIALSGVGYNSATALETVGDLQAIFDGAVDGSITGVIERAQEKAAEATSMIADVISCIPVPGISKVANAAKSGLANTLEDRVTKWAIDAASIRATSAIKQSVIDAIQSTLSDQAEADAVAGTWQASSTAATDGQPGTRDTLKDSLSAWTYLLDPEGQDLTTMYKGNYDDYLNSLTDDYDSIRSTAAEASAQTS